MNNGVERGKKARPQAKLDRGCRGFPPVLIKYIAYDLFKCS